MRATGLFPWRELEVTAQARQGLVHGELPVAYRYDNDIYHFFLIASTFMIYRGFKQRVPATHEP